MGSSVYSLQFVGETDFKPDEEHTCVVKNGTYYRRVNLMQLLDSHQRFKSSYSMYSLFEALLHIASTWSCQVRRSFRITPRIFIDFWMLIGSGCWNVICLREKIMSWDFSWLWYCLFFSHQSEKLLISLQIISWISDELDVLRNILRNKNSDRKSFKLQYKCSSANLRA